MTATATMPPWGQQAAEAHGAEASTHKDFPGAHPTSVLEEADPFSSSATEAVPEAAAAASPCGPIASWEAEAPRTVAARSGLVGLQSQGQSTNSQTAGVVHWAEPPSWADPNPDFLVGSSFCGGKSRHPTPARLILKYFPQWSLTKFGH